MTQMEEERVDFFIVQDFGNSVPVISRSGQAGYQPSFNDRSVSTVEDLATEVSIATRNRSEVEIKSKPDPFGKRSKFWRPPLENNGY